MEELEFLQNIETCIDLPRESDYNFWDMFEPEPIGATWMIRYNNTPILNQGRTMACTCFWLAKCCNEENYYDDWKITDAFKIRDIALTKWASATTGWSLQSARDLGRELWLITGYTNCRSVEECKQALSKGNLIHTWTNKCNWVETHLTKYFVPKDSSPWHCFAIIGYDDSKQAFIAANSSWETFGDKWLFYIKYSDYDKLFTTSALLDKKDKIIITNYKKMKDEEAIKKSVQAWIISETNLDKPATRYELAIMFGRLLDKLWK